jgi:hypothetical protein
MQADTTPNVLETQTHEALGPCTALCEGPLKQGHSSHPVQLGTTGPGQYAASTRMVGGTSAMHAANSTQDLMSAAGAGAAGAPSPWLLITGECSVVTVQW